MLWLSLAMSYGAFVAIALSMRRHRAAISELQNLSGTSLRTNGFALLALAPVPIVRFWDLPIGMVGWIGILSFAALLTALMLAIAPRLLWAPAAAALVAALLA